VFSPKNILIVLIFLCFDFALAQDLKISTSNILTPQVYHFNQLQLEAGVWNDGSSSATETYCDIYLSKDLTFSSSERLSRVSITYLFPGDTGIVKFRYHVPSHFPSGDYYVGYSVDAENDVVETNESNIFYDPNKIQILNPTSNNQFDIKLPYPILFIHGLNSDAATWNTLAYQMDSLYGLTYGGEINFCLNGDGDVSTADQSTDIKDFTDANNLITGDYYYLNFDVDSAGNKYYGSAQDPTQSNQAAIFKQGIAVQKAIDYVMSKSYKDKVILVGHSMGGLASREYLQNPNNWVSSSTHQVAKLGTIATPHDGSEATALGLLGWLGFDELTEAMRDLRPQYNNGTPGLYLYGGIEDPSLVSGSLSNFDNVDANCNGQIYDNIAGLNQKSLPNDVSYACVIGYGYGQNGDGVVSQQSASLNNIYSNVADTFMFTIAGAPASQGSLHTKIHNYLEPAMKVVDEPNTFAHAFELDIDEDYYGWATRPSQNGSNYYDYDRYKIQTYHEGELTIELFNINHHFVECEIYDASFNLLAQDITNFGGNYLKVKADSLPEAIYYVKLKTLITNGSYKFPYMILPTFERYPDTLDCGNSIPLQCGVTYNGTSSSASSEVEWYGCNNWTESGPERVHQITPSNSGTLTATLSNYSGDLDVFILGSCDPSDCLGTVSSNQATFNNAQAGQTYYIVVDADDGSGSSYDLTVSCPGADSTDLLSALSSNIADTIEQGSTLNYAITTSNSGPSASSNTITKLYLSTNTTLDTTDIVLGSFSINPLQVANNVINNGQSIISVSPGNYYLISRADDGFTESEPNEINNIDVKSLVVSHKVEQLNCANTIPIQCGVVFSGTSSTDSSFVNTYGCNSWTETGPERIHTITPSFSGQLTATISNFTGDLDVYILGSCNPTNCLGIVSSNQAVYDSVIAGQTYYIVVDADDGSGGAYDLIVDCPQQPDTGDYSFVLCSINPDTILTGDSVEIGYSITNSGNSYLDTNSVQVYFSTDQILDNGDVLVLNTNLDSMAPGDTIIVSDSVFINAAAGVYYSIIIVDSVNMYVELNENNNNCIQPFYVDSTQNSSNDSVDFEITMLQTNADTVLQDSAVDINVSICNLGNDTTVSNWIHLFLSNDNQLNILSDSLLDSVLISGLLPGECDTINFSNQFSFIHGDYYLIGYVDLDSTAIETNESNNVDHQSIYIDSIEIVGFDSIDLVLNVINLDTCYFIGESVNIVFNVDNLGSDSSGNYNSAVYWSADSLLDVGDLVLNSNTSSSLAPTGAASFTLASTLGSIPGVYYLINYVDNDSLISEINEGNNIITHKVTLKQLPADSLRCGNAIALSCGVLYSAPVSNDTSFVTNYSCVSNLIGPERVHEITSSVNGYMNIQLTNYTNLDLIILDSCDELSCKTSSNNGFIKIDSVLQGETFVIVVDGTDTIGSGYDLLVECLEYPVYDDIELSIFYWPQDTFNIYQNLNVVISDKNVGLTNLGSYDTKLAISQDSIFDPSDQLIEDIAVGPLTLGSQHIRSISVPFNNSLSVGDYYLIGHADYNLAITENAEINNRIYRKFTLVEEEPNFIHNITNQSISIFPNPTRDILNINSASSAEWKIRTIQGALMSMGQIPQGLSQIEVGQLPAAVYLFEIGNGNGDLMVKRLVIH
jgi:pimeloyl-ACP methyl ester carboxylesterase